MAESDLKPCPFCGKTECIKVLEQPIDVAGIEIVYIVYCTYCGGQIRSPKRKDAIMAWNRRADDDLYKKGYKDGWNSCVKDKADGWMIDYI